MEKLGVHEIRNAILALALVAGGLAVAEANLEGLGEPPALAGDIVPEDEVTGPVHVPKLQPLGGK